MACIWVVFVFAALPALSVVAGSGGCGVTRGAPRAVRFWVGADGAGGSPFINRTTNATCSDFFLGNISKYLPAVSSIAPEVWTITNEGDVTFNDGSISDAGLSACLSHIHRQHAEVKIGLCGSASASALAVAASNASAFVARLESFIRAQPFSVDEIWTDFEVKGMSASEIRGANALHATMQTLLPTFRYAGCEPRDAPYFSENCSAFVKAAPDVVVQASNTYWSTTVSGGWYGGFAALLQQEISNIGGRVDVLSPAICPDCATGSDADNSLSQQELYDRMDIVCNAGIRDVSVFTFFEVAQKGGNDGNLGERYFEALSYFRTGVKGNIIPQMRLGSPTEK